MIYKKITKRHWKSLNKRQKKQVKDILRDINDRIIYEYAETIRIPNIHQSDITSFIRIDETRKIFEITIKVTKDFYS